MHVMARFFVRDTLNSLRQPPTGWVIGSRESLGYVVASLHGDVTALRIDPPAVAFALTRMEVSVADSNTCNHLGTRVRSEIRGESVSLGITIAMNHLKRSNSRSLSQRQSLLDVLSLDYRIRGLFRFILCAKPLILLTAY